MIYLSLYQKLVTSLICDGITIHGIPISLSLQVQSPVTCFLSSFYKVYRYFLKILKGFLMKIWKNFQILFSFTYKLRLLMHLNFTPNLSACQYVLKLFYCLIIYRALKAS